MTEERLILFILGLGIAVLFGGLAIWALTGLGRRT